MGLVRKPGGKCWYYQFTFVDDDGKRRNKSVSTSVPADKDSERAKTKALEEGILKKNEFLDDLKKAREDKKLPRRERSDAHARNTVAEYAEFWLKEIKGTVEDSTLVSYTQPLRKHIIPRIGHIVLEELDQYDLKEFINAELADCEEKQAKIDKRKAAAKGKEVKVRNEDRPFFHSIRKHLGLISMILDYAVGEMDLEKNVAKLVNKQALKRLPESDFESIPYNKEEIAKLREAIRGDHLEPVIILASYLGLRRQEALGLRWQDVDFENQRIYIRHICRLVGSKVVYEEKTKTKSSKASLAMIAPLRDYLLELKKKQEKDKKDFGSGYQDSDLICRWNDGHPIIPNNVSQGYNRLLKKAGLRHTRFHDLRHTVGEIILEETHDIKLVSDTLRHANIQTTADIYTRSSEASIAKGLEALDTENRKSEE